MSLIHVIRHHEPAGPFTEEEIHAQLSRGELTPADLAWREGMADWQPLSGVIALPATPPPPPRAARPKRRVPPAHVMTGQTEFLEVYPDRLTITPKGGQVLAARGTQGIREIPLGEIASIEYKLPGFSSGYLRLVTTEGREEEETLFRFDKHAENTEAAGRVVAFVEGRQHELSRLAAQAAAPAAGSGGTGLADELSRLAALHGQGALTDGEFHAAKQRLLS